jgi:hypothetical protein
LGVNKEASEEDIKRAYKKLAIKFHPDKNQSSHAEEAFKKVNIFNLIILIKISHAFTTLKDPEKKQFYDKYGTEEEFREKYHQQQTFHYEEDEMDPFDLFEMFFSNQGFYQRNGRVYRRQRNEQEQHQHNRQRVPARNLVLIQFLPFFVLILFSVLPYLFQTTPYYQFFRNEDYYKKMTSSINKIDYYVGEKFLRYYTTREAIANVNLVY